MKHVQTLIHGKHIIPMDSEARALVDFSIAINDGCILDILPTPEVRNKYSSDINHTYDHHIIIPGLINAHTHAAMALFRGFASDKPLMDWLQNHIWPAEQKWVSDEFVEAGTELAIAEMIRGGTTCFNDMYFFAEVTAKVAAEAGMRAHVGMVLLDFPTKYANDANEYLDKGLMVHDQYKSHPLVRCTLAPHAPYTVSNASLERVIALADELALPVHTHLHETKQEVVDSLEEYKMRPLQRLYDLGLVNDRLIAVHMTRLQDDEIDRLAETGVNVVHCPESNLKLASGFCPVQKLMDKRVNVALGTDGCASNDDLDILGELHTAALLAKGVAEDAAALPAYQSLRCITINAATALGIEKETGSLETGKSADMAIIDIDTPEARPVYDPFGHLVYAAQRQQVSDVWVAGRQLLREGNLTTLDQHEILLKTKTWEDKILHDG